MNNLARFTMRKPDDFHLHLRENRKRSRMLDTILPYTTRWFRRALVMPNTTLPILNADDVCRYRKEILVAANAPMFEPLMTIQVVEKTNPETIRAAREAGAVAGKIYPRGMTTNSENGVSNYRAIFPALEAMEQCGMVACFHGESPAPGVFCLDREVKFLGLLREITRTFPRLKIVMEHVTTAEAVKCVAEFGKNVAATITVHHLFLTLNDVVGDKLRPHNFCKPIAKRQEDRKALIQAAMSGNPKFFLGTDSAPHLRGAKECGEGCAGIFTAPVAIPLLLELFKSHGTEARLEDFCSSFGADFYGLPRYGETITLVRNPWTPPAEYNGIVPFCAGREIAWQME